MTVRSAVAALAGTLLFAASQGAAALPRGLDYEARFANVALSVLDLTPGDGAAAGYSITGGNTWLRTWYGFETAPGGESAFAVLGQATTASIGFETVAAAVSTGTGIGELGFTASTRQDLGFSFLYSKVTQVIDITIDPHSMVTLSGDALQRFAVLGTPPEWTDDYGAFAVSVRSGAQNTYWESYRGEPARPFWLDFANAGDTAITAQIRFDLTKSVVYYAPPYPVAAVSEPDTYALLGAGLALVGFAARRQCRAAGAAR